MLERLFGRRVSDSMVKKNLFAFLKLVFGFNKTTAYKFCSLLGVSPQLKFHSNNMVFLKEFDNFFHLFVKNAELLVDRDLSKNMKIFFVRHFKIGSYKAKRMLQSLPLRGQRTHTNAATAKRLLKIYVAQNLRGYIVRQKEEVNVVVKKKVKK